MSEEVKEIVKKAYTARVTEENESCCGPSCCSPVEEASMSESYAGIEGYEEVADYGLGCGIPTEFAKIKEGDTVLDLGSGAGNDVFVARRMAGPNGSVIGVDFTEAMIEKAVENRKKLGYENIRFLLGEIENLPLEDNTIDVVLSNCVMNLVPDKLKAYSEVFRVLKPGGHFSMSDIVLQGDLPEGLKNAAEMYAGCVAGAMEKSAYIEVIKKAGFTDITLNKEREIVLPDELLNQYLDEQSINTYKKSQDGILSITVTGYK